MFPNYIERSLVLVSVMNVCVSVSAFSSLLGILIDVARSVCAITAEIKEV